LEATIYKRRIHENDYGIAILCEGLVNMMDKKEIQERFGGDVDMGHQDLGRQICAELQARFKKTGMVITTVARHIGTECRAADPSAGDIILSRDLGYGAVRLLLEGNTACMVTIKDGSLHPIPLSELLDPKTGQCAIRSVDTSKLSFQVAQNYMVKLKKTELSDGQFLNKISKAAKMTPEEFVQRFKYIAV